MANQNIKLTGSELLNPQLDNYNFIATEADGLVYLPESDGSETEGLAQVKFDAMSGTAPLWKDVKYNLSLQDVTSSDNPIVDFNMIVGLYGVTDDGNVELVGEDVISTPSTTLTSSTHIFDLLTSACHSKFFTSTDTGTTGKITLKLPFRTDYIEDIDLMVGVYSGWKRLKTVPILGNAAATANIPILVTIPYVSNMNNDFSDIRFIDWNGNLLDYGIWSKTDSSTATFAVKLATTPESGVTKNVSVWYKKSDATSTGDLRYVYNYLEDWEDCKYTGRTSPYKNWTLNRGTVLWNTTTAIRGSYTLNHRGDGIDVGICPLTLLEPSTSYTVKFKTKLQTLGSLSNVPYIFLWYFRYQDSNNWLRADHYWNGSNRLIRLVQNVSGTPSVLATYTWVSTNWALGESHVWTMKDSGSRINIICDSTPMISINYTSPVATGTKGFGCNKDSRMEWEDIRFYPYISSEPTIGILSSEKQGEYGGTWSYTDISPDSITDGTQQVQFTTPTMDINAQSYITYNEYGNTTLTGNKLRINNGCVIKQGYNGLDAYKSLILRFEVDANSNYTVKVNSAEANYEV